jgi:hypothetical protein
VWTMCSRMRQCLSKSSRPDQIFTKPQTLSYTKQEQPGAVSTAIILIQVTHHRLDVVGVYVEDGAVECLGHVGAVGGGAGLAGVGGERHLFFFGGGGGVLDACRV